MVPFSKTQLQLHERQKKYGNLFLSDKMAFLYENKHSILNMGQSTQR